MIVKFPKIKDVIPLTNGVFSHMDYTFREEVTKAQLDYLFLADAAQRNPAPVIDLMYDEETEEPASRMLTDAELTKLAALMLSYYKPRWEKLGDIYDVEYDPIHNYLDEWEDNANGWEHSQLTHGTVRTDRYNDLTVAHSDVHAYDDENPIITKETEKRNETVTRLYDAQNPLTVEKKGKETTKESTDTSEKVKGFNSSDWVDTDRSVGSLNDNQSELSFITRQDVTTGSYTDTTRDDPVNGSVTETKKTGAESNTGSDITSGSTTREMNGTDTTQSSDNRDRSGSHSGNIGNLTSQKMLHEEIELWKWNYIRSILDDAIKFLTLDVYL